jgi:hypothetical protein
VRQFTIYRDEEPSNATRPQAYPGRYSAVACGLLILFASLFAIGFEPALWFQPTAVGVLWASIFLSGFLIGGLGRGKLWAAISAGSVAYLATSAFRELTEIAAPDSLLLSALLMFVGWLTALFESVAVVRDDSPNVQAFKPRCFIWDIAFITLLVAIACHALPRMATPPVLLLSVIVALSGGLLCNWIACRWVWNDCWSPLSLLACVALFVAGITFVCATAPQGISPQHALSWALTGPVNVIAAQGVTVLFVLGLWRFDLYYQSCLRQPAKLAAR